MINIAELIARELDLRSAQVQAVIDLLNDGATVPFISRYRKEATGAMDEVAVRNIEVLNKYYVDLEKRIHIWGIRGLVIEIPDPLPEVG